MSTQVNSSSNNNNIILQSLVAEIVTHADLEWKCDDLEWAQCYFRKQCSPFEKMNCDFKMGVKKIDRLYYFKRLHHGVHETDYALFCRLYYNDILYFVSILAHNGLHGWSCGCCSIGTMYFIRDPTFFFEHIVCRNLVNHEKVVDAIRNSMAVDGYEIAQPLLMTYHVRPSRRTNPPTLSHLIHETVYTHRFKLLSQKNEKNLGNVPAILMNGIRNFITLMDWLINDYEN